jgi:DNA-binding HxlR family transcriptional regulator
VQSCLRFASRSGRVGAVGRDYGQFCGLARAAGLLGERWALLVVRDLMVAPRRFSDLLAGLPGLTTNVLTARLRELEAGGVVERRPAPLPRGGVVYALTGHGADLRPALDALGLWGARRMDVPAPGDVVTDSSLAAALQAAYRPGVVTRPRVFALHAGPARAYARVDPTGVEVGAGACPDADLTISATTGLRALLAGTLGPRVAVRTGQVAIDGRPRLLDEFVRTFRAPLDPDPRTEEQT